VATRIGAIPFYIPQVRDGAFYPHAREKGVRSERAPAISMVEMYVHGISTRKVTKIADALCGKSVSSSQVSRAATETARFGGVRVAWRTQGPLAGISEVADGTKTIRGEADRQR